jgi:DNA-binding NarL/FixJ family response regulator
MNRPVRILIADDQRATRQGLAALLNLSPDVNVVGEAADGQESLDLVAECHPDVVLMDLQMPVMDGFEATRTIKARWPEVRVIALTMYAGDRAEALSAGADEFVLKGSPAEALYCAIRASSNGAGDSRQAEPGLP